MRYLFLALLVGACNGQDEDDTEDPDTLVDSDTDGEGQDDAEGIVGLTLDFLPHALLLDGDRLWVVGEEAADMAIVALKWEDLTLDTSWATGGSARFDFGGPTDGILRQDFDAAFDVEWFDGNLVLGGVAQDYGIPGAGRFGLAMIDTTGALVPDFGEGGLVMTDWGVPSHVQSLSPSEESYLSAWGAIDQGGFDIAATRYDRAGLPDYGYSDDGVNAGIILVEPGNEGANVVMQAGDSHVAGGPSPSLRRFGPNGLLDATFAGDGVFDEDDANFYTHGFSRGPELFVAGTAPMLAEDGTEISALRVVRMTTDGVLVDGWAEGGVATIASPLATLSVGGIELPGSVVKVRGFGMLPDESLVVYAQAVTITGQAPILMRLTPSGALDTSFGEGGALALPGAFALFEGTLIGRDDLLVTDGFDAVIIDSWLRDAEGGGIEAFPVAMRFSF